MNEKIDQSIDQATEGTESTSTPAPERKPIVLKRHVVRELSVRTGLAAGAKCIMLSVTL